MRFIVLIPLLLLTACQTNEPTPEQPCPLTHIDTHVQEEQCRALKAMPQTEAVKQKMLAADCGLFF